MNPPPGDDAGFDPALLHKADALIRRNRTDGVAPDAEELPTLTDVLDDDLPELTEAVAEHIAAAPPASASELLPEQDFDAAMPSGRFQRLSPLPPEEVIEQAVDSAVARLRDELEAEHRLNLHEAVARARADALTEARQMNQRAVQAALQQGREEAEINQWPALQAARSDAVRQAAAAMSERLIELDAQIAQSLNGWLARELPPIIASELLGLSERLRVQAAAHVRATLMPELSEQISKVLDSALRSDEDGR